MSDTLERIEREIAREVLDAVAEAVQTEVTVRRQSWPATERQPTLAELRPYTDFVFNVIGRVAQKYDIRDRKATVIQQ